MMLDLEHGLKELEDKIVRLQTGMHTPTFQSGTAFSDETNFLWTCFMYNVLEIPYIGISEHLDLHYSF